MAVVRAQLTEQSLPIPQVGSHKQKMLMNMFTVKSTEKTKVWKKWLLMAPFKA